METTNTVEAISAYERATVHVGNNYNTFHEDKAASKRLRILQQLYQAHGTAAGYPNDYESHKDRNPPHVHGTCEWFLSGQHYELWIQAPESRLLWLTADAGCGKSVLASTIVDTLRKTRPSDVVCHFFFRDDNKVQADGVYALQALLHQVLSARATVPRTLATEYDNKGGATLTRFQSLWEIFLSVVAEGTSNVLCVLDGLDECESTTQSLLLAAISKLYTQDFSGNEPGHLRTRPYLKIILTARPLNAVTTRLRKTEHCRLRGEDQAHLFGSDIQLVVKKNLSELAEEGLIEPRTRDRLCQQLLQQHDNTFLWAALVMNQLRGDAENGASEIELLANLKDNSIWALYAKFLDQCVEHSRNVALTKCFLQIILAAARPLTLEEMDYAISLCVEHRNTRDLMPHLHLARENFLKRLGGSFVTFREHRVHLIHQTAREYLLQNQDGVKLDNSKCFGSWHHSLGLAEAHGILAQRCVWYLLFDDFNTIPTPASSSPRDRQIACDNLTECHPFLHYASHHWHRHLRNSCPSREDKTLVDLASILSSTRERRFWTWIYVFAPRWASRMTTSYTATEYLGLGGLPGTGPVFQKRRVDTDEPLPLLWASLNGYVDVIEILFMFNPNLYILGPKSHTEFAVKVAEHCLVWNINTAWSHEIIRALLSKKVSFDGAIISFARSGSAKILRYFIDRYPEVVTRVRTQEKKFSLLILAIMHQQLDTVKALCNIDPELIPEFINLPDYNNRTALDYALILMDAEMFACLADHGAKHSKNFGVRERTKWKSGESGSRRPQWDSVPINSTAAVLCTTQAEAARNRIQDNGDGRIAQLPPRSMVEEIEEETCKSVDAYCRLQENIQTSRTVKPSPYEILDIAESERSDPAQLRKRYRQKVLQVHPDRLSVPVQGVHVQNGAALRDETAQMVRAAALFHEVHEAYELLRDPVKKKKYDSLSRQLPVTDEDQTT
ncbi:hypothetical protein BJX76DRAFT_354828 [Aspergillus varians]